MTADDLRKARELLDDIERALDEYHRTLAHGQPKERGGRLVDLLRREGLSVVRTDLSALNEDAAQRRALEAQRIAYHEAGHAVTAHELGLGVREVQLHSTGGYSKHIIEEPELFATFGEREARRRLAVVQFAGKQAQLRWREEIADAGDWQDDVRNARANASKATAADDNTNATFEQLKAEWEQESRTLVAEHWLRIKALAVALSERGTLSGEDIVSVIENRTS